MRSLLLDSHALIWWQADDPRLGESARRAVEESDALLYFSAASIWELAIKQQLGKLDLADVLLSILTEEGFTELPVSAHHGQVAGRLPLHHKDPFDRMIVAQAQCEGLTVVTHDPRIAAYGVPVLW